MPATRSILFAAFLTLAGCNGTETGSNANASVIARSDGSDLERLQRAGRMGSAPALLAAAEPFETLTERAFRAKPSEIDGLIADAEAAVLSIQSAAPQNLLQRLEGRLIAIRRASKADNRADIALASIEGFRDIVSAVPGSAKIPVEVGLLDYAGFRYEADVQATPPRWQDMTDAVTFARMQWSKIEQSPALAKLQSRFGASLDAMDEAIKSRDVANARRAAKIELDLVDDLERAF